MLINEPYTITVAAMFGMLFGSFLNVLIYRLPREESIVFDRSRCPHCKKQIRWYDNVPVLGWLMLGGRCRSCQKPISKMYPIVELISGVIAAIVVYRYGPSLKAVWIYAFLASLLVITIIDWHHKIIPDSLSLGGVVFGWVGSLACLDVTFIDSLIGSLVGGGLLFGIAITYRLIRKVEGMGGGDVKLMAMIGAFLGWKAIFPVLFVASFFGSIYGIYLMRRGGGGKTAVAFGSFLAPAATFIFILGARLWQLYLGL